MNLHLSYIHFIFFYTCCVSASLSAQNAYLNYSPSEIQHLVNMAHKSSSCGVDNNIISTPDVVICNGESVQLNAEASYSSPYWYPSNGLSNAYNASTVASPASSQYYYFLQIVEDNTNLIFNGDFEQGDVGFFTDYGLAPDNWEGVFVDPEGLYAVDNNPNANYNEFEECRDHTSSGGNMLMATGSERSGDAVWCQTIRVNPGYGYRFEAWFTPLDKKTPGTMKVTVNGQQLGTLLDLNYFTCDWEQFAQTWYSANSTSAEFCIYNTETSSHGNNFAVDDISVTAICPFYDSVYVQVNDVDITADVTDIPCYQESLGAISASVASTHPFTFNWVEFPTETSLDLVDLVSGTYTLNVIDDNNCTASETFEIHEPAPLESRFSVDSTNCLGGSISTNSQGGTPPYNYTWSNGETTASINQLSDGYYSLSLTDANNCLWMDSAFVNNIPVLNASLSADSLTCDSTEFATITSSVLTGTPPYNYVWSTTENSNSIQVYQPGSYTLTITDQNNCMIDLAVNVWQPYRPMLDLFIDPAIDSRTVFQTGEMTIFSNNFTNTNTYFNWTTSNNEALGVNDLSANHLTINPRNIGSYAVYLDATSADGCFASDSITFQVVELPFVGIPTAFTPNNDGTNDSFYPIDVPERYVKRFQIYNQWGSVVYDMEKDGYLHANGLKGWTGQHAEKNQSRATYIYVIVLDFPGFRKKTIRGTVTLIR